MKIITLILGLFFIVLSALTSCSDNNSIGEEQDEGYFEGKINGETIVNSNFKKGHKITYTAS